MKSRHPMRFFVKSLLAIVVALLISGLLTYPVWSAVSHFADYRPDRVMRRIGLLLLAIALVWILRREGLADRATFGYGLPRRQFVRQMLIGFIAGLLLMLPLIAGFLALDIRSWNDSSTVALLAKSLAQGIIVGVAVSFVEETFLRGAMFTVVQRESGTLLAVALPSLLFAAVHFILDPNKMRVSSSEMNFVAGLQIAANAFADFATPLEHIDAFFALLALGILLSLVRLRTGAIAGSIGLHAGGVAMIAVVGDFTVVNSQTHFPWLIASYNSVVGWLACVWISIVAMIYWRVSLPRKVT
jgi:uncharacterized protein